jgi:hypothetical protein
MYICTKENKYIMPKSAEIISNIGNKNLQNYKTYPENA